MSKDNHVIDLSGIEDLGELLHNLTARSAFFFKALRILADNKSPDHATMSELEAHGAQLACHNIVEELLHISERVQ